MIKPEPRFRMWLWLVLFAWVILLLAGFVANALLQPLVNHDGRWILDVVTLATSVATARRFQGWLLSRVDPDGDRRRELRELFE